MLAYEILCISTKLLHGLAKWGQKDWHAQCPGPTKCGGHLPPRMPHVGGV